VSFVVLKKRKEKKMAKKTCIIRITSLLLILAIMFCVTSCGTILYPERRGQAAGRIDVGVAVLNGIGLLVFLVPGVIAFAVDFSTGAIYLPSSSSAHLEINPAKLKDADVIKANTQFLTRLEIETLVKKEIHQDFDLASPKIKVAKVNSGQPLTWGSIQKTLTPGELAAFENMSIQDAALSAHSRIQVHN
jgi:hypothetical protein